MRWLIGVLAAMAAAGTAAAQPLAIEHVTVLSMTAGASPASDRTVIIDGGRIVSVDPSTGARPPEGARRIDGRGRWLMPGLTDMHVHMENERQIGLLTRKAAPPGAVDPADILLPYLAWGVTQVVNMSAMSEDVGLRRDVEAGKVAGPHLVLAAMIDGQPPIWPVGMSMWPRRPRPAAKPCAT